MTGKPPFQIGALGEIAIRCDDLSKMARFYENILGLQRMAGSTAPGITFFRIAPGFQGHTQILALFANTYQPRPGLHPTSPNAPVTGARSSLHHIALSLPYSQQDAAMAWYDSHGLPYRVEHFDWIGWRGVFTQDPEGNTVELVAFHPDLKA